MNETLEKIVSENTPEKVGYTLMQNEAIEQISDTIDELEKKASCSGFETMKHRYMVQHYINILVKSLIDRASTHDQSKIEEPEKPLFDEMSSKLKDLTFGSEEYYANLEKLKPALDHHYANNSHHPEHYANGINDMDIEDIAEMICDWKASSKRQNDGNILKSLETNKERYHIDEQLYCIIKNTIERFMKD